MPLRRRSEPPPLDLRVVAGAARRLELPEPVFRSCPFEPRELVAEGLRQWLRCCGAALRDGQVIGMPSHAVDEAWHGLILCTVRYERFCREAYGRFLHHHPEGSALADAPPSAPMSVQLDRTIVAWELARESPEEECVLFDLDARVGDPAGWGVPAAHVADVRQRLPRA